MRKIFSRRGQSVIEYILVMIVILAGILASTFLGRVKGAFTTYVNNAASSMAQSGK